MVVEQNPNYAANEAWSRASTMVRRILEYLEAPDNSADRARDLSSLIADGERIAAGLAAVSDLRTTGATEAPAAALVEAVERCIDFEVNVVMATEIKRHRNPETEKWTIHHLMDAARG